MKKLLIKIVGMLMITTICSCSLLVDKNSAAQLLRLTYMSTIDNKQHQYFVYLPRGYHYKSDKKWPLMLFLHGNGERGNGNNELDYVLKHGPVYEVWIQKKDLPFIIISPQLPMFDQQQNYMKARTLADVPKRLAQGVPKRPPPFATPLLFSRTPALKDMDKVPPLFPQGWEQVEDDLLNILSQVARNYHTDKKRYYLTGLSYGGQGTWFMASKHPTKFAAIAPVVGWGHPSLMAPIAKYNIPVWQFAAGKDQAVPIKYFYAGLNKLVKLGDKNVRFTVHEDMNHDTWTRVYASRDLYEWFLQQSK